MTDAVAAPAEPAPSPAPPPADPNPAEWAQVRGEDGNPTYVKRDSLPAETPKSASTSTRPSWVPETCWNADTGFSMEAYNQHWRENVQPALDRHNAEEVRQATLPGSPDKYEAKTSPAFKVPDGVEFQLEANDPIWTAAKEFAHRHGLTQRQFEEGMDIIAGRELFTRQKIQTAYNREIEKLGPSAATRVQAIENFYEGLVGRDSAKQLMSRIFNAGDVQLHEAVVRKFGGQRGASPTRQQRGMTEEEAAGMRAEDRYNYARQFDQSQFKR